MSCDWDVRCLDCEDNHGFSETNHQDEMMMTLAKLGPELAAFAPTMAKIDAAYGGGAQLTINCDRNRIDFSWFAKHGHHRLIAVDERKETP